MTRHEQVDTVDDIKLDTNWQDTFKTEAQYAKTHQQLLNKLAGLQVLWDGGLGRITWPNTASN